MKQKGFSKTAIILIIIGVLIAAAGIWYFSEKIFEAGENSGLPWLGQKKEGEKPWSSGRQISEAEIPAPPSGQVSIYKGFWMPAGFMDSSQQSMWGVDVLKDTGANIVFIAPNIKINGQGEARYDMPEEYIEEQLFSHVKKYYEAGFRVGLAIETSYVKDFNEGMPDGGPGAFPKSAVAQPGYLTQYNKLAEKMAALAQKYQLEIFSPMNEPDMKLGENLASKWGQEILPIIRQNYKGKILWKAAGGAIDKYDTNFKGYDIIGFDPTPGGGQFEQSMARYRQALNSLIAIAKSRAQRNGVSEVMITEFGVWGGALSFSEDQKVLAHRLVFELGQGKVDGFIALDPPPDLDRGLAGTKTLAEIKSWFKEKLK